MSRKAARIGPVGAVAGLFLICVLTVFCACLSVLGVKLSNAPVVPWEQLVPLGVYVAGVPVMLVWLRLIGWKGDAGLVGAVLLLSGMGLVIQFRMGSFSQGLSSPMALAPFPIGLAAFALGVSLTGKGRGTWLSAAGWLAYLAAMGVLVAMLMLGRRYRGGMYMPGNMNPSEIVKPLLVFFLAAYLSRRQKAFSETQNGIPVPPFASLLGLVLLWGVPMLVTIALKDLGLMVLLNAILIVMLFAVARSTGYLAIGVAAVAEEIGFIGCALLLLVYAVLFSRGFRAAGAARTPFERLLCVGLTATLAVQTLLNVAGVTKALPMTGITLPLISHGGSSLITTLLVAGLIAGLSDRK